MDLDRVEEVLVITGTQPDLTPAAQQDLAAAAAQHAADLSAERLPGIYDDQTPGAAGGVNGLRRRRGQPLRLLPTLRQSSRTRCPPCIRTGTAADRLRPRLR